MSAPLAPRRPPLPLVLAFAALAALAAAPRVSAAELAGRAAEDLSQGAAKPDDFKRVLEGSIDRRGDVAAPEVLGRAGASGRTPGYLLRRADEAARPGGASVPPAYAAASRRADAPAREVWTPDLKTRKLAAVLGLGLLLIAGSWLETPREVEDAGAEAPAPPLRAPRPRPEALRVAEPSFEPSRFAESLAEPRYVDTRMPASTWRAISWREQSLIEAWDASPEKSAGRASLAEWLDSRGEAAGVDVPLLKAKLFREA